VSGTHHDFQRFQSETRNPPCSFFNNGWDLQNVDNADVSTLTVGRDFVEFYARKGKKVTATW
jgi:hypothetical protein